MTADLIVTDAVVVAGDGAGTVLRDGAVAVRDGRIVAVGPAADIGRDAVTLVEAGGAILMPGFVNTHCHAGDSLFRGLIEDLPLEPWLQLVWRAEGAMLTPQTVRLGATLGFGELLLAGVTTVLDMFWHPFEAVEAARAVGIRISTGGMFFDGPGVDGLDGAGRLAQAERFIDAFAQADDVMVGCHPHGAYTVGPETLRQAGALADRHGVTFSIHAAETRAEQAVVQERHGRSVVRHLEALGLLGPRTVLAHCVHLDDEEIAILARTGTAVAHNPVSNLKLASGIARVPDMLSAGVRVTLGTDGAISGNDLDPWLALRLAAMLHRGATEDATAVTMAQAFRMATLDGAAALGAADRIGSLEVGKWADMVVVDRRRVHAVPLFDALTHLVFSAGRGDVRDVFVGGRRVVRDGALVGIDVPGLLAEVGALVPRIAQSIRP